MRLALVRDEQGRPLRAAHDADMRMPGRGAYVCGGEHAGTPAADCMRAALRRKAIPRALRAAVPVDSKLVESFSP
jgi:predicted RNA-binding protein YlxR (DUF448 family)